MSLHMQLKDQIETEFASWLAEPVYLAQDALLLSFDNGVMMEIRYAGLAEYSIAWTWGEAALRIDTAPVHPQLATFPNHLHDSEERLLADPITQSRQAPWDNVRHLLHVLLADPLLESGAWHVTAARDPAAGLPVTETPVSGDR